MKPEASPPQVSTHIEDVRAILMKTLNQLTDREHPMEVDRARAVAQVAAVMVDTAKVEVDYLRATGAKVSSHLQDRTGQVKQISSGTITREPGRIVHRMGDE